MMRKKTRMWLWQSRRVATQANAAGGAILVDITVPSGVTAELVYAQALANATNHTVYWTVRDEDDVESVPLGAVGAAAANVKVSLPSMGAVATASNNSIDSRGLRLGPGAKLTGQTAEAGVQNDTLTIAVSFLMSVPVEPTWSVARSTNPGNVSLAASTISAGNSLQAVWV